MEALTPPASPDRMGVGYFDVPQEVYHTLLLYLPSQTLATLSLTGYSVYKKSTAVTSMNYYWTEKISALLGIEVDPLAFGNTDPKALYTDLEKVDKDSMYVLGAVGSILTLGNTTQRSLDAALNGASRRGLISLMKFLLDKGANPNANDGVPLRYAIAGNQPSSVATLLKDERLTPSTDLLVKALKESPASARLLILDGRVDYANIVDNIRMVAARHGYDDIIALLNAR